MAELLTTAAGMYSTLQVNRRMVQLWRSLIGHLDLDTAKRAFAGHMRSSSFEPKAADILRLAAEITRPESLQRTAGEMWEIVRKISRRNNPANEKYLAEKYPRAYAAAMQVGGFSHIGLADQYEELPFIRRDFLRFYEEMTDRDDARERVGMLPMTEPANALLADLKLIDRK